MILQRAELDHSFCSEFQPERHCTDRVRKPLAAMTLLRVTRGGRIG